MKPPVVDLDEYRRSPPPSRQVAYADSLAALSAVNRRVIQSTQTKVPLASQALRASGKPRQPAGELPKNAA